MADRSLNLIDNVTPSPSQTPGVHEVRDTLRSVALPGDPKPFIPGPRRPFPAAPSARTPLGRDIDFNRGAYDEAFTALQRGDRYEQHAAYDAFGAA